MSNVKYIYARDEKNFPVGCFAFTVDGERLTYAYSVFYMGDTFKRQTARSVAYTRLNDLALSISVNPKDSLELMLEAMMLHTSKTLVSPWAKLDNLGFPMELGHRFKSACKHTANHLRQSSKDYNLGKDMLTWDAEDQLLATAF